MASLALIRGSVTLTLEPADDQVLELAALLQPLSNASKLLADLSVSSSSSLTCVGRWRWARMI